MAHSIFDNGNINYRIIHCQALASPDLHISAADSTYISGITVNYAQPDSSSHQPKLLPKTPVTRQTTPNRRVGKEKPSSEIICIDSDEEDAGEFLVYKI